jgi:hypothetical protein
MGGKYMPVIFIIGLTFLCASAGLYMCLESLKKERIGTVDNTESSIARGGKLAYQYQPSLDSQPTGGSNSAEQVFNIPQPGQPPALPPPPYPSNPSAGGSHNTGSPYSVSPRYGVPSTPNYPPPYQQSSPEPPPPPTQVDPKVQIPQQDTTAAKIPSSDQGNQTLISSTQTFSFSKSEQTIVYSPKTPSNVSSVQPSLYTVHRELRITYSRMTYTGKACHVNIKIAKEHGKFPDLTPQERMSFKEVPEKWLQFDAHEREPFVQVELLFAEGEFSGSKTKAQQILKQSEDTLFQFVVKPLKDEDCILTVVISYVLPEVLLTFQTRELMGNDTKAVNPQEVLSVDLVMTVNSLFGLSAGVASLAKNALGIVGAGILLFLAAKDGQLVTSNGHLDTLKASAYMLFAIANIAGVPIVDAAKNLFAKSSN